MFLDRSLTHTAFEVEGVPHPKLTVGLCGYPNVGKSSTINALVGAKKVSVSSTPGHTKNYQTIHLSDQMILCDCPGLVFPQFATTKAEMVCDGVLPIDQMREHTGPVALVTRRIPKEVLEAAYGLQISTLPLEDGGSGIPTASELLTAYSIARGFFTQGQGNPDEARSSRYVLKDFVAGKLLYARAPPGIDEDVYNAENRDLDRLRLLDRVRAKRAPTTRVGQSSDTYIQPGGGGDKSNADVQTKPTGRKNTRASALEQDFFNSLNSGLPQLKGRSLQSNSASAARPATWNRGVVIGNDGRPITDVDDASSASSGLAGTSKRHFKASRSKQRSGRGYE